MNDEAEEFMPRQYFFPIGIGQLDRLREIVENPPEGIDPVLLDFYRELVDGRDS